MKLYSWGANSHGQLGQGTVSETCSSPHEVDGCDLDAGSITHITGGGGHTLLLDRSGRVYASGWNNRGQLGLPGDDVSRFCINESLQCHNVAQLACGWDSSLAITSSGTLVVWGSNSYGQLGTSKQKLSWTRDPKVLTLSRVKQASLGLRHMAVITLDGKLFVCGSGGKGQLGILDSGGRSVTELSSLTEVSNLGEMSAVACGQHHTVALSKTGQMYVWGDNRFGQLGFDSTAQPVLLSPQEVNLKYLKFKGYPASVFTGWTHSVIVTALCLTDTDEGEIINWGRNTYGQLGTNSELRATTWKPAVLNYVESLKQFQVGSEHNIALTDKGHIYSWGWNEHGNCGIGTEDNVHEPSLVPVPENAKAECIGSGACHSFAVLDA